MSTVQGRTAAAHTKPSSSATSAGSSEFFLQVTRGKTAHPVRPISRDRFLIGAGNWCDLCLGGAQMPVLHSVIHLDGEQAWIDAVGVGADLKVNGKSTSFAQLQAGDRIEIGAFAMSFQQSTEKAAQTKKPAVSSGLYDPIPEDLADEDEADLTSLSAAELVDLIESDLELVEEFERRKRRGTDALLDAVRRHRADEPEPQQLPTLPPQLAGVERLASLFNDLEVTIESIGTLAKDLERQAKHLSSSEVSAAAATLLQFQQQVVSRLDEVLAKVAKHNKSTERRPQRRDAA